MSVADATSTLREALSFASRVETQNLSVAVSSAVVDGKVVKTIEWVDTSRWTGLPSDTSRIPDGATRTTIGELAGPPTGEYMASVDRLATRISQTLEMDKYYSGIDTAGKWLGTIGGVFATIDAARTAWNANEAFQAGNTAGAIEIIRDWAMGTSAAFIAGALGFAGASLMLAPLAVAIGAPIAIATAIGISIAFAAAGHGGGQWLGRKISDAVSSLFRTSLNPPRRDPLAIDLDGDGIETTGIPTTGNPILFDHDADGVKTGTGWLKGDDAWLVLDRNGNGSIDSGRELFGADTMITVTETLPNTSQPTTFDRNARTGFEALASLDTGNGTPGSAGYGDKVFDARDVQFANVKVWQDLNQDGISQGNELFTLAAKGITAISLNPTTTTTNLGNGNTVTGQATVTRTGGPDIKIDSVDLQASNLNLADNPFYRQFSDRIPLTNAAKALPDMRGSGILRDLREAMSLNTPQAQALVAAVQAFSQATTRDQQMAALDALVEAWASTGPDLDASLRGLTGSYQELTSTEGGEKGARAFESMFGAKLDALGLPWRALLANADFRCGSGNADTNALIDMTRGAGLLTEVKFVNFGNTSVYHTYVGTPLYSGIDSLSGFHRHVAVLDAFNGQGVLRRLATVGTNIGDILVSMRLGYFASAGVTLMEQAYGELRSSVYGALVVQTRLRRRCGQRHRLRPRWRRHLVGPRWQRCPRWRQRQRHAGRRRRQRHPDRRGGQQRVPVRQR